MSTFLLFAACLLGTAAITHAQLDSLLTPVAQETVTAAVASSRHTAPAPATHTLGADAMIPQLEKELSARMALTGDLKLTLAQSWKPLTLPVEDFSVVIVETPNTGLIGTFVVRAKIMSNGEMISDLQLSLRARLWQDVWTSVNRLERGQLLDRSLLTTTKLDVLSERQPPLLAEIDPSALEVAQTISAGHPLTRRDVMEHPIVRKGQVVEVFAQQGQMAITMKALALENGACGDLIKLRNIESRKEFSGQILNENRIQVQF